MKDYTIFRMVKNSPTIESRIHYAFLKNQTMCGKAYSDLDGYKSDQIKLSKLVASRTDCKKCINYLERFRK